MKKSVLALILLISVIVGAVIVYVAVNNQPEPVEAGTELAEVGAPAFFSVNSTGKAITTSDGKMTLDLPSNALTNETTISIHPIQNLFAAGYTVVSAYRFGPEGTSFLKPATLSVKYDPSSLPSGLNEGDLRLFTQQSDGDFAELEDSFVNLEDHVASGKVSHFSFVSVAAPTRTEEPEVAAIVGRWDRTDGVDKYSFYPNGTTKTVIGGKPYYGSWAGDGSGGYKYVFSWEHSPPGKDPFVDYITIADDGNSYSGVNNYDDSIHCVRVFNQPPYVDYYDLSDPTQDLFTDAHDNPKLIPGSTIEMTVFWKDPERTSEPTIEFVEWTLLSPDGEPMALSFPVGKPKASSGWLSYYDKSSWPLGNRIFTAEKAGNYTLTVRAKDEWGAIGSFTTRIPVRPEVEIRVSARRAASGLVVDFTVKNSAKEPVEVVGIARGDGSAFPKLREDGTYVPGFDCTVFNVESEKFSVPAGGKVTQTVQTSIGKNSWTGTLNTLIWNARVDNVMYSYETQITDLCPFLPIVW